MTAVHDNLSQVPTAETLAPALRRAHGKWLLESNRFLLPVVMREAPFWSRWTAVRFLADQFLGQYRRELALLEELRPFLAHHAAERLTLNGERIRRLQCTLDRVGRRRGAAHTVSVMSRELLQLLRSWCADIEEAAGGIPLGVLTAEGNRVLMEIEMYARAHA